MVAEGEHKLQGSQSSADQATVRRVEAFHRVSSRVAQSLSSRAQLDPVSSALTGADGSSTVGGGSNADDGNQDLPEIDIVAHTLSLEELATSFQTDLERGLSDDEAKSRLERDGYNELTPSKRTPAIIIFLRKISDGFSLMLWAGAFMCFGAYILETTRTTDAPPDYLYLGVVLAGVVLITGTFSFIQEYSSSRILASFDDLIPKVATVTRSGETLELHPRDLVAGDLVQLRTGLQIPADIRLIHVESLHVDNSILTGESEAQSRSTRCTHDNPLETKNLCFSSTFVESGSGRGIVVATGDNTVIGQVASVVAKAAKTRTAKPIQDELKNFIHKITIIALVLGVSFFILGFIVGNDVIDNIIFMIGIIVANVPEGLLATVTVALTLTAKRMAARQVVVKALEAVEALGSTSVICSDKTGTLTQNRMSVVNVWYDGQAQTTDTAVQERSFDASSPSYQHLLRCAVLCNTAEFVGEDADLPIEQRRCTSDASEAALIKFAHPQRDIYTFRDSAPLHASIPFTSANKWMLMVRSQEAEAEDPRCIVLIKGAPERILQRCSLILVNGEAVPLDEAARARCQKGFEVLGAQGKRVLGFCERLLDASAYPSDTFPFEDQVEQLATDDMVFVGLIALIDPPREAVPRAVSKCRKAGIRVIMITGDHPLTAQAIARQVNIIRSKTAAELAEIRGVHVDEIPAEDVDAAVVTGAELAEMSEEDLDWLLANHQEIVFARISPTQKLVIVEGFKRQGQIVAVTGDGVNDSPALTASQIGVAMGSGTDVAKGAADLILLDDSFASIVVGVEEGRRIFDNLKKSIAYTLSSNIPEIVPFLSFVLFQIPLPLTTVMILGIDLGTDLWPAIAFAYEKAESDLMQRPPRQPKVDRLVTLRLIAFSYLQVGIIQAFGGYYSYALVFGDAGWYLFDLVGLAPFFSSVRLAPEAVNSVIQTCDGVIVPHSDRLRIHRQAQTAFFISIVIVQISDALICKTRLLSLFQHGLANWQQNLGFVFEVVLALFLTLTPGVTTVFGFEPIKWWHWFSALPFSVIIFVYDELRKYIIRSHKRLEFTYY